MKIYVINSIGWEYDDNNYNRQEGGYPVRAFKNKDSAEKECEQKNLDSFINIIKDGELQNYTHGSYYAEDYVTDKAKTTNIFQKMFGCSYEYWIKHLDNSQVPLMINPSPKDWKELYSCFALSWYEVVEIEMKE